jgi:hypothetical protein
MRRFPIVLLLVAPISAAHAQKAHPHVSTIQTRDTAAPHDTAIPVTRVSLYKNGVGFFEHTGTVTGNAAVTLSFTSSQLNDVLQSLTAIDLNGGRISGAAYNSTTPLEQQLKSISLGLPADTTYTGLFTTLRGTRIEVRGSGAPFTGRLVDIEMHKTAAGKDSSDTIESRFLTVASDSGEIRIFQMTPALSVDLLDTAAHTDLTQYLQLLDGNRNQGFRRLTIDDNGTGTRELNLSYISEVPIWKSTYRILMSGSGNSSQTATLQGWSVVDNTTSTDWINVHLALISGAPQSFIQPLSQPIYSRRPEIPIAQQAQLTPQTHDSSIDSLSDHKVATYFQAETAVAPRSVGMAGMGNGSANGVAGGLGIGEGAGMAPGVGANFGGGEMRAGNGVTYEDLAQASVIPSTTTAAFDDFFAYNITDPVTILKNQSALVPILQAKVPAEPITLVSYSNSRISQPLRALWITNTSSLTLDRGSFTIIEDGRFAGEGLLDPIHPDEKRLLSYAADQAVHVSSGAEQTTSRITSIVASHGVLTIRHAEHHEVTLVIHNAASSQRTVLSEIPVVNGWKLDSLTDTSSADPKPVETTASVYRFRSDVAAGETVNVHVGATRSGGSTYYLTQSDDDQFQFILNETNHNPALEAALQLVLGARRRVSDAQAAVDQTNSRLADLRSDEERQRANITALQNADKSSRERFVNDLNKTEDAITAASAELTTRTTALDAAKTNLSNLIESFQIDETV